MAVDGIFLKWVVDRLSEVAPIQTRRMFGSVGVYCGDCFIAIITGDKIYFKTDDTNRHDYESLGMTPFVYGIPPRYLRFHTVPDSILNDHNNLADWIDKTVDVAQRAKAHSR